MRKPITPIKKNTLREKQKSIIKKGVFKKPNTIDKKIRLDVIVVSVNYNDLVLVSLMNNVKVFDNITIVTSTEDKMCQQICKRIGVRCVLTDSMYDSGAKFNKGKAINEGIKSLNDPDYILIIDADIVVKNKINLESLNEDYLYTSDRWICKSYGLYKQWENGNIELNKIGSNESDKGIGFFQLFNINNKNIDKDKPYPETSNDAAFDDLLFRDKFVNRTKIEENVIIHLGDPYINWNGRVTRRFLTDDEFTELFNKKSTFTICSFYFNYNNDWRQKRNFIKFLEQWKDYYQNMIVGIVDYGDIDFEIPCEKVIIEGDVNKRIWSKEILINKIVEKIDTDYILWIDGDIIYEDLNWLNNLDNVIGDNEFIQLFETINYLGENGEVLESHKSLASDNSDNVDNLLGKGYKPGGSWMTRTKILKSKPLFEKMLVGGGDTILAYGLYGKENGWTLGKVKEGSEEVYELAKKWISDFGKKKVGYLPVTINHLYHGDLKDRNYNERYLKLEEKKRGIMLISFGFDYEKITPMCIRSIRKFTNVPITVHTNVPDFVRNIEFDSFENIRFVMHDLNDDENRVIKTQLSKFSEYDETIYIDVDSTVLSNEFLELFDFLKNNEIISPLWKKLSIDKLEKMKVISKRYEDFYKVINEKNISSFNFIAGGICAFKKTDNVDKFFSKFYENWEYFGRKQDMPALNKTLIESTIKLMILDKKRYNLVDSSVIKSNHVIGDETYKEINFIRSRYNPSTDRFEFVKNDKEVYFTKKKICFLYDTIGWAFYNKSHNIKKNLNDKYEIDIIDHKKIKSKHNYDVIINFSLNLINSNIERVIHGISSKKNLSLYDKISKFEVSHTNNKESFEMLKNKHKFLLYNGVNIDFFYFKERKLKSEKINIGAVGSSKMLEHKGYYRIKQMLSRLGDICNDKILFIDPNDSKNASEMRDYYQSIDILIISSFHENTPNPLLEAMSCGVPVITNNTGMAKELIKDGYNGFIINDYNDIDSYIEKIKILHKNVEKYNRFSILSRDSVENYSWQKMSLKYEEMIEFYINSNKFK